MKMMPLDRVALCSSPRREPSIFEGAARFVKRNRTNKLTGAKRMSGFRAGFPQCSVTTVTEREAEMGETPIVIKVREPVRRRL